MSASDAQAANMGEEQPVQGNAELKSVDSATKLDSAKNGTEQQDSENGKCQKLFDGDHMVSIADHLQEVFGDAINAAYPGEQDLPVSITVSAEGKGGDYQCNSAMAIFKKLKGKPGAPANPRASAQRIVDALPASPVIGAVSIGGPGFINITVADCFLVDVINDILKNGIRPPKTGERKRILVDFSSPNVAKEMHVGHLRSTIIGDTISRLLEFLGNDVLRINHVGDWGTQFGMLIAHLKDNFPEFGSTPPALGDLQAFYKEAKARYDKDADFALRARGEVVKLQSGDPEVRQAWKYICDTSRAEFQKIYNRLGVVLKERGESFYQPLMPEVVEMLEEKGMVTLEDGRKVAFLPGYKLPLILVKSDGGYTYDSSDMAAIYHRMVVEKVDWNLYVVDSGQALHFELIYKAATMAGFYDPAKSRVEFIGFGVVQGEDRKKFKTRSGESIKLSTLLDEALVRARKVIEDKQAVVEGPGKLSPEEVDAAVEAVAYGAVKYNDLKNNRASDYIFSFDRMLDLRGDTAVYLLYAYTRIASIGRRAGVTSDQMAADDSPLVLEHPKEIQLAKFLAKFPETIMKITRDIYPHMLCNYLYELSTAFTSFYDSCQCVTMKDGAVVEVNMSRLKLCEATARTMATGFDILGLKYVNRM